MKIIYLILIGLCITQPVLAVNSVNPSGVNVSSTGVTSVFLTFRGTIGQTSSDAFWCGDITVAANTVTTSNPCVPGTFFGRLPKSLAQTNISSGLSILANSDQTIQRFAAGKDSNFTDVMTIPASVSRRAMQSARNGNNSSFFYIRKFESNGIAQYIAVTCRMSNGGARVPFSLTHVQPYFATEHGKQVVFLASQNQTLPSIQTDISYNGTGRLKGRWEVVLPGDTQPSEFDLAPTANLPIEKRDLQKRYTLLQRFNVFLPPNGKTTLKGPEPHLMPNTIIGPYQIVLRIEASRDKEGNSDTGAGVSFSGGVSGFVMPIIRYYVATDDDVLQAKTDAGLKKIISLFEPILSPSSNASLRFNWMKYPIAKTYKLEVKSTDQALFSALVDGRETYYDSPPWITEQINQSPSQWRVVAFDSSGKKIGLSQWRKYSSIEKDNQE